MTEQRIGGGVLKRARGTGLALDRREGREQDVHVADVAQPALIGMHPGEIVSGIA